LKIVAVNSCCDLATLFFTQLNSQLFIHCIKYNKQQSYVHVFSFITCVTENRVDALDIHR
jgi:hypothetical protein